MASNHEQGLSRGDAQASHSADFAANLHAGKSAGNGPFRGKPGATQAHPVFWLRPANSVMTVDAAPGASAHAVLAEVEESASRFAATGEGASIDLRCLKAMPQERETLAALLGRGEVSATIDTVGRSEVYETSVPCVWWVRHWNTEDEIVGELIEIAEIPELLMSDRKAVAYGLAVLRMQRAASVDTHTHER